MARIKAKIEQLEKDIKILKDSTNEIVENLKILTKSKQELKISVKGSDELFPIIEKINQTIKNFEKSIKPINTLNEYMEKIKIEDDENEYKSLATNLNEIKNLLRFLAKKNLNDIDMFLQFDYENIVKWLLDKYGEKIENNPTSRISEGLEWTDQKFYADPIERLISTIKLVDLKIHLKQDKNNEVFVLMSSIYNIFESLNFIYKPNTNKTTFFDETQLNLVKKKYYPEEYLKINNYWIKFLTKNNLLKLYEDNKIKYAEHIKNNKK